MSPRPALSVFLLASIGLTCSESEQTPRPETSRPETLWIEIAGEPFELELALDPQAQYRGLGAAHLI